MTPLLLHPRDVLFFRDARPMSGSSAGSGAGWPLPSTVHQALLSAFHDRWPDGVPEWESDHRNLTEKERRKFAGREPTTRFRFGGLRTVGPFPVRLSVSGAYELLLPTPADVGPNARFMPAPKLGADNLPTPLQYLVANSAPPSKDLVGAWLTAGELMHCLRDPAYVPKTVRASDLYGAEPRPGVGIDPDTHANLEHVFYQAEYMRLCGGVCLGAWARAEARRHRGANTVDLLERWGASTDSPTVILGGQRGLAHVELADPAALPTPPVIQPPSQFPEGRVTWVLLTPALFTAGWRPGWINHPDNPPKSRDPQREDGAVLLTRGGQPIAARLVAARIPKPLVVSGWKLDKDGDHAGGGAKPTRLLVPAGAVYYFQCEDAPSASALCGALHGRVKSDLMGEKGFGFGVCGAWAPMELGYGNPPHERRS